MKTDPHSASARAFVRSLNILLKFARLYGYDHVRTIEHLEIAWRELQAAIPPASELGLLLGASGSQLLLDGVPLEGAPAERQFALLLSTAGIASVQFFPNVTQEELRRFARAFPTSKAKPAELALQLKNALVGARGVRINEICFIATDARLKDASVAAQLAVASLGDAGQDQFKQWLNDPKKLLELIAAAQGSHIDGGSGSGPAGPLGPGTSGTGTGMGVRGTTVTGPGVPGTGNPEIEFASGPGNDLSSSSRGGDAGGYWLPAGAPVPEGLVPSYSDGRTVAPSEAEMFKILGALTSFGQIASGQGGIAGAGTFQQQIAQLPGTAQATLRQAIAGLAAQTTQAKPDETMLVQLAEHLAIRFALEQFEHGDVKVSAVRQMLDRMNQEIESLRNILGSHENKMTDAGILVESHREILDRQFWAAVPDSGKQMVLLSEDAWCIPPRNVQSYVAGLLEKGNVAEAIEILQNYASCADSEEADARKKAAAGLSELAELYSKANPRLLGEALRHVGLRLSIEQDAEVQGMVSAAFVRLSQEAASSRSFSAMEQALELLDGVEAQRPGIARSLRGKMGIEERVPDFVDEALRARQVAGGLTGVLKLLPQASMEQLSARFNRCSQRQDAENVANLAGDLGEEGLQYLRSALRGGPVAEAVEMVGLLSKLDPQAVEVFLPGRIKDFSRSAQDRIARQVSGSGATGRCRILLDILDYVDPLVMPLVIDEIGMSGNCEALGRLLTIVDGDLPIGSGQYLRVKAVEALGRIPAAESIAALKRIAGGKKVFGWTHSQELRIAALQALEKLDLAWAQEFLPKSGIENEDLTLAPLAILANSKFVRQRRHTRVRLRKPLTAVSTNLKENCRLEIKTASLAGGVATISRHLAPGTQVQLKLQLGLRNLQATALMRDYRAQDMAFEIVDMNLDERTKYRRLLAGKLTRLVPAVEEDAATTVATVNAAVVR
ncbi:MAG: hypothetical protein QOF56_2409 [Acidobacteriaceae bacterium]|nr:hypothetical protein [Acidobacteriaceae bacterium]